MKGFIAVLLLLVLSCSSEPKTVTKPNPEYQLNWKKLNFRGAPEAVYEVNFKQLDKDSTESITEPGNYYFDDKGNLERRETFAENLNVFKTEYEYDDYNNIVRIKAYDGRGNFTNTIHHTFDSVGNVKEILSKDDKGNVLYRTKRKFDTHGNIIEFQQTEPLLPIVKKRRYTYDDKGRMTLREDLNVGTREVITYDNTGTTKTTDTYRNDVIFSKEKIVSDAKGNLLESTYSYDTTVISRHYRYDSLGNVLEYRRAINDAIDSSSSYQCEYQYDEKFNWTKRTTKDLNGTPRNSIERNIVY